MPAPAKKLCAGFVPLWPRNKYEFSITWPFSRDRGLTKAENGWLVPGRNPFGLYLYLEDVDGLAAALQDLRSGRRGPEDKPWGMYEFAIPGPDEELVRIGWPSGLRNRAHG